MSILHRMLPWFFMSTALAVFCLTAGCSKAQKGAQEWLNQAAEHCSLNFQTEFQVEFAMQENQRKVQVTHRGRLEEAKADHYRLQARTLMTMLDLGDRQVAIDNLQVADGQWLWMQSTMEGRPQPIVLQRPLEDLDGLAQADEQGANQLSPADLNPMLMWRMAIAHGQFEVSATPTDSKSPAIADGSQPLLLLSAVTPEFLAAAAHRAEFWQPRQLRISLHRSSAAPVSLELLREDGSVSWKVRFHYWKGMEFPIDHFAYTPPPGVQVMTQ